MSVYDFLATATVEDFAAQVDKSFFIKKEIFNEKLENDIELTLVKSEKGTQHPYPGKKRDSFSLLFTGPLNLLLPQSTYPVENDELGSFPIFLVPLGDKDGKMYYQAIFS